MSDVTRLLEAAAGGDPKAAADRMYFMAFSD
jgi:hypothetical protein